jgi:hypothetical protein
MTNHWRFIMNETVIETTIEELENKTAPSGLAALD